MALALIYDMLYQGVAAGALFAIPIFSRKERGLRPRLWVRVAAASGLLATLLFVALSILPSSTSTALGAIP